MLFIAALLWGHAAWAEGDWFTITGDAKQADLDTVQVDPETVARDGDVRTVDVRVNRAKERISWDGMSYRSYSAKARIVCKDRRGEYTRIRFHRQPLWQGDAQDVAYAGPRPPMLFRDIDPNPVDRIIRAACVVPPEGSR